MTTHVITSAGRLAARGAVGGLRHGLRLALRTSQRLPDLPDLPEARPVDLPGRGTVHVVDTGAPYDGAPTLLLMHGLATTALLNWFSTLDDLRAGHRVVMLDARWHGRGIVGERFSLDDCADDAAAVLDVLGIDEAVAVGYSMGGALAQVFWRRHPHRTAGLVLASTAACWRVSLGDAVFYPVLGLANAGLRGHYRGRVEALRDLLADVTPAGRDLSSWAWAEFRSTSAWAMPEVLGHLGGFDSRPWLGEVDVPTAVVVTARDRAIPTERQRALAAAIPGARVHEAPGGHASVVFDLERWRPVFLEAVASVVAASARERDAAGS